MDLIINLSTMKLHTIFDVYLVGNFDDIYHVTLDCAFSYGLNLNLIQFWCV